MGPYRPYGVISRRCPEPAVAQSGSLPEFPAVAGESKPWSSPQGQTLSCTCFTGLPAQGEVGTTRLR